ncbi:hypothetical protein EYC80_003356 [Monilinia laxa]|uniref:PKS/mFAS DH domain-containing protein n=1 Tax=Monilinia laxa TaxID=61186 RepID=A0A5N6KDQ6_MONLA|nr:hypothetical protein EYC80_003356 [Monilinia laxa]
MSKIGITYGPMFLGLQDISAHPVDHLAVAKVENLVNPKDSPYQLHPTTTDCALQLFGPAASRGQPHSFVKLLLPQYFGEIYTKRPRPNLKLELSSSVSVTGWGAIHGDAFAIAGSEVVLKLLYVHLVPAADNSAADIDPVQAIESSKRLVGAPSSTMAHLEKYRKWLAGHVQQANTAGYEAVDDASHIFTLSSAARLQLIEETAKQMENYNSAPVGRAIIRTFENSVDIFTGKADALDLLMQDEILRKIGDLVAKFWDFGDFLGILSHTKPDLKILEIGAGTRASTSLILDSLVSPSGERAFHSYTYTNISAGFFVQAKERFKNVPRMKYSTLDVSKDPAKQGFELGVCDLVIATNVLHATPYIGETLVNVRKLLQPEGRLMLQEICSSEPTQQRGDGESMLTFLGTKWFNFIVELTQAGFNGLDAVVYDEKVPYYTNATMIASPHNIPKANNKRIPVLSTAPTCSAAARLSNSIAKHGFEIEFCSLTDTPKPNQDVISILDLEGKAFLENVPETEFNLLKAFIASLKSSGMLWMTKSAQVEALEDGGTFERALEAFEKFQARCKDLEVEPDFEYAISRGVIHVPRFQWVSISDELFSRKEFDALKTLEIGKRGALKTLQRVERPESKLTGDEIYIEMRAAGVNFKSVLITMGIVDNYIGDGNGLGRIFNSRNSSFLPEIMREANGYGLDVVLNSLSGDLLHASWKCLAEFGKMLENGKRDFIGQGQLPMDPFEANRTFYGVDLTLYVDRRPLVINSLLERAMEWCSQGAIQPIKPVKYFEAHQAEDVLRGMQSGQHIGKLVVRFPTDHTQVSASRGTNRMFLGPDVSYFLVGGLGGLGRSILT